MSFEAKSHVDLRAQILDNWRYVHPTHLNVTVIVAARKGVLYGCYYTAMINQGSKVFAKTRSEINVELALHELLDITGDKINEKLQKQ